MSPTKLIIQIPCLNEEKALPVALSALPKSVPGIDEIEVLIIDDGSTDRTVEVAHAHGVHHVVGFRNHQGLARAFMLGIRSSLARGADIIVNTDADNQYDANDIAQLVAPVLEGRADMVVGRRPIELIEHFSRIKRILQRIGSRVVARISKTEGVDAPSGFRAFSRKAALSLNVFSDYTYTLETLIQAVQKGLNVVSVPVRVNAPLRESRLVRGIPSYIRRSLVTIVRILIVYRPFRFFAGIGAVIFAVGLAVAVRFLGYYIVGDGDGHIQSLILASVLLMIGFQTMLLAFIADLLSVNRRLIEEVQLFQRSSQRGADAAGDAPD